MHYFTCGGMCLKVLLVRTQCFYYASEKLSGSIGGDDDDDADDDEDADYDNSVDFDDEDDHGYGDELVTFSFSC